MYQYLLPRPFLASEAGPEEVPPPPTLHFPAHRWYVVQATCICVCYRGDRRRERREAVVESGVTGPHVWGITAEEGGREGGATSLKVSPVAVGGGFPEYILYSTVYWMGERQSRRLVGWSGSSMFILSFTHGYIENYACCSLFEKLFFSLMLGGRGYIRRQCCWVKYQPSSSFSVPHLRLAG